MKEARIILPMNTGLTWKVQECIHAITHAFGGATITDGTGMWKHPNGEFLQEPIRVVDIAYEPSAENDAKLYDMAHAFLEASYQIEVYLRYGNGNVQMVTEKSCMDNGDRETFDFDLLRADLHRSADDVNDVPEVAEHVAMPSHCTGDYC